MLDAATRALIVREQADNRRPHDFESLDELRRWQAQVLASNGIGPEMALIEDAVVAAPYGEIAVRLLIPTSYPPRATVVYLHDGGMLGSAADYETIARKIAERTGAMVVQIRHRQTSQDLPPQVLDIHRVMQWLVDHVSHYVCSGSPLILLGDGIGGDQAMRVLLGEDHLPIAELILLSPLLGGDFNGAADPAIGELPFLVRPESLSWAWSHYAGTQTSLPLDRIGDLPPTLIVAAEHDPARQQAVALRDQLGAAGVDVRYECVVNGLHGFFGLLELNASERGFQIVVKRIRRTISRQPRRETYQFRADQPRRRAGSVA